MESTKYKYNCKCGWVGNELYEVGKLNQPHIRLSGDVLRTLPSIANGEKICPFCSMIFKKETI